MEGDDLGHVGPAMCLKSHGSSHVTSTHVTLRHVTSRQRGVKEVRGGRGRAGGKGGGKGGGWNATGPTFVRRSVCN